MVGFGERLKQAAEHIGGLDVLAAKIPEMSRRSLSDYVSEKTDPRAGLVRTIATVTGVDAGWLLVGGEDNAGHAVPGESLYPMDRFDMIRLPVYSDVRASAGPGAAAVSERSDSVISFDPRFLRDQGAAPERCSVIWAHGDSMMPTIPDGSALIVDQSQTEVRNGSIMVIGVGDDLMVKRVRRRLDGLIDLISDNSAYAPETLGPAALQQLRIVGRVVYFCRTP